mgnify:CR=1 FL=1
MAFKHISIAQTLELLDKEDVVIADIRDPNAHQTGHMPGSEALSNANIAQFMMEKEFDQPIIIVCYHGMSSQGAASYLVEQGFDDVYSVDGGFEMWRKNFPFVSTDN